MKPIISFFLAIALILSLCACNGNYARTDLKKPIPLPDDGIISKPLMAELKKENAIATFTGISGEFYYEWKIFGNDIKDPKDVNLLVSVEKSESGVNITLSQSDSYGFSAMLSVTLSEKWTATGATAYKDGTPFTSVSITGSKNTVLNIPVSGSMGKFTVLPDEASAEDGSSDRPTSDGSATEQDKYLTDPVPEGKPLPTEPENQEINKGKTYTCTFSIECSTILNNLPYLDPDKLELIPSNGVILPPTEVTFFEGESVFDVLLRVCKENGIHLEFAWTPIYNSAYIEGIYNLYEFDCGELSGWMYRVNGWYPNYGCSRYQLSDGDTVEWRFTCDLGDDVGRTDNW